MIDETYKLIAVPYKLRKNNDIDYRKLALKKALEIYYKKDLDNNVVDKIIIENLNTINEYEKDKEIRNISHNMIKSIIQKCLRKFD